MNSDEKNRSWDEIHGQTLQILGVFYTSVTSNFLPKFDALYSIHMNDMKEAWTLEVILAINLKGEFGHLNSIIYFLVELF